MTDNFDWENEPKFKERVTKRLRLKTSPVDENSDLVEQHTQSYGLLLYLLLKLPGMAAGSIVFPSVSTSFDKRRLLIEKTFLTRV